MNAYHIIEGSGDHVCIMADTLGQAYEKYKKWATLEYEVPFDEIEDVQSIAPVGTVID